MPFSPTYRAKGSAGASGPRDIDRAQVIELPAPTARAGQGEFVRDADTVGLGAALRIGEMVDATGVSERLLRYYESRGLLTPRRTNRGHRLYTQADVARVRLIRLLLDGGMSTKDIQFLLECVHEEVDLTSVCGQLDSVLEREFGRITREIRSLELTRQYIAVLTGRTLQGQVS
ncbi:MerR family transcriptional regulator [Streptomyces paromomycinus]|uniref:MerR family transcriptional regulator n=1 Tax=Streptomyces paromomycinus TaxID=92743 RepID=A0A401W9I3_STREY|nr:MerR family transcriptional regulator [Streptomyces paromomycinus]GCD45996.1 MerR family transcriptional regulator [Streptomyces paromomycinus]